MSNLEPSKIEVILPDGAGEAVKFLGGVQNLIDIFLESPRNTITRDEIEFGLEFLLSVNRLRMNTDAGALIDQQIAVM